MKKETIPAKLLKILSTNLTQIYKSLNLNQKQFAELIGISPSHLCEILGCGVCVSLSLLDTISIKTGVPAKYLLDEDYSKLFLKDLVSNNLLITK
jgi:transcriptional regulator with XRE-family HTH domain